MSEYRELPLAGRHVALGVTGSIAAFKAADLCSKLRQAGAAVEVVMTAAAAEFVTPLTFRSLSGRPVVVDMFGAGEPEAHIEIARRAEVLVIAPATANTLASLAQGTAANMVALTALATAAPVLVAPAMDGQMWQNAATRENVDLLRKRGIRFTGPVEGRLATGRRGGGRMVEVPEIVASVRTLLGALDGDFRGRHVLVSAGPTYEPLDPVRFLGNRSSGKMGFALAEAARDRGARVTLVAGPVALAGPFGVQRVDVQTVEEMMTALHRAAADAEAFIMAAAPADFRPAAAARQKMKKAQGKEVFDVEMTVNPDILAAIERGGVRVGFAAETENLAENAVAKLAAKRLDLIVANDVTAAGSGFGTDTNRVTLFHAGGLVEELPLLSKYAVANAILDRVHACLLTEE